MRISTILYKYLKTKQPGYVCHDRVLPVKCVTSTPLRHPLLNLGSYASIVYVVYKTRITDIEHAFLVSRASTSVLLLHRATRNTTKD